MPDALPTPLPESSDKPTSSAGPELHSVQTRQRVGDILEIRQDGQRLPPEHENRIIEAIETLQRLIRRKKLSQSDLETVRASMKTLGNEQLALEALGADGTRRYFEHLSGGDATLPYAFPMPIEDQDLEAYLMYDLCHDDPAYQDQAAMDYLDEPVDSVAVNILISRLKANPDFLIKLLDNPRIHDGSDKPYLHQFTGFVKTDSRFELASTALSYFFYYSKRNKLVVQYDEHKDRGRSLKVGEWKRKIRKLDERFLSGLLRMKKR